MEKLSNFIGGIELPPQKGHTLPVYEPATGLPYATVPDSSEEDLELAIQKAQEAFVHWSQTPLEIRGKILRRLATLIEENLEELAQLESKDTGKPLTQAQQVDIPRSAKNFSFFADAITQFHSECDPVPGGELHYTLRDPLGVVGVISPWNLPLYLLTWKIAPALAAGNTVIAKPSEITPRTAARLAQLAHKAGLPPGVLNILHGSGQKIGRLLVAHPAVQAISFTGGTQTGREIAKVASPLFKKISLELGGKNPFLVFADADLSKAIKNAVRSGFSNQGQICLCGSRILIESKIYHSFKESFLSEVQKLKVGDPLDPTTTLGALVSSAHLEKVMSMVKRAQDLGGKILTGGKPVKLPGRCENGYFMEPTVIEGLPSQCETNQQEIFGPVVTLLPFSSEKEALALANDTVYGLAASLWTKDLSRAHRLSRALQVGMVWVNTWMKRDLRTPFGGIKHSGLGKEGGREALRFFTEAKNICVEYEESYE